MQTKIAVRHQFHDVEIVSCEYQGVPVVLASQVGSALGYVDPSKVAENISGKWADEFVEGTDYFRLGAAEVAALRDVTPGLGVTPKTVNLLLLTPSGADLVAIHSRTKRAVEFRRWLVGEVLPAHRRGDLPDPMLGARIASLESIVAGLATTLDLVKMLTALPTTALTVEAPRVPSGSLRSGDIAATLGVKRGLVRKAINEVRKAWGEIGIPGSQVGRFAGPGRMTRWYSPGEVALVREELRTMGVGIGDVLDLFGPDPKPEPPKPAPRKRKSRRKVS